MRHFTLLAILITSWIVSSCGAAHAEPLYETLDPGPLPTTGRAKPFPMDWRGVASPGVPLASLKSPTGLHGAIAASPLSVQAVRPSVRPMLPPPDSEVALRRAYDRALSARRRWRLSHGKPRAHGFSLQSLADPAPDQEYTEVKATPVYLRSWSLEAGHEYRMETRHLSAGGDTVLAVISEGRQIAANDDRAANDPSSALRFTPKQSGVYQVMVRAADDASAGTCDLYVDGVMKEQGLSFAGTVVRWDWQAGDQFQTAHLPSTYARPVDTVLFAVDDGQAVAWNDDGGIRGCSRLSLPDAVTGRSSYILVGSMSPAPDDADWVMLYRNALSGGDSDGDGLADKLELSLGTDPHSIDTDGDGLRDDWELFGVHTPYGDEDLPSYAGIGLNSRKGSDSRVKDLFLEIDWMAGPDGDADLFRPLDASLELITRQFQASGGVALHIDLGQMGDQADRGGQALPYQDSFDRVGTAPLSLEDCFSSRDWFAPSRHHLFGYIVCASHFPNRNSTGQMVRFREDGTVDETQLFDTPLCPGAVICMASGINGSVGMEAGTLMHELGHCLNLQHGGFESTVNFKPNYVSSMNYLFELSGLDVDGTPDYSHGSRAPLDERALDERAGVGEASNYLNWSIRRGRSQPAIPHRDDIRSADAPGAIDWNDDGQISDRPVRVDLNGDGWYGLLRDFDDWSEVCRPAGGTFWVGVNAQVEGCRSYNTQP